MNAKLTLTVDKMTVEAAKRYAKASGRSLSGIVEEYLKSVVAQTDPDDKFTPSPLVDSLWGSVNHSQETDSYKDIISDAIAAKYLR